MIVRCLLSLVSVVLMLHLEFMLFVAVKNRAPSSLTVTPDSAFFLYVSATLLWAAVHLIMWKEPEEDS